MFNHVSASLCVLDEYHPPAGLALEGRKVLLFDTDPQTNTTRVFIHPNIEIDHDESLYSSLINLASLSTIIRKTKYPNLDIVPSHIRLSSADLELAQALDNRSERLKRAVGNLKEKYDYIVTRVKLGEQHQMML